MQGFIDLVGASGTPYRFRLWPEGAAHLPIAGNYVVVRPNAEDPGVLLVGASDDLSRARAAAAGVAERGATRMFTRLNVARAVRMAEHDDLVAGYPSAAVAEGGI